MKVGIIGISGRMGSELVKLIPEEGLSGGVSTKTSLDEIDDVVKNSDVVIDFSRPMATLQALAIAGKYGRPFVSGTTGFIPDEFSRLIDLSKKTPVLHASNFSLGIQFIARILRQGAQVFQNFDFSIIERHHKHKKDSPSGTALFLAKQVTQKKQIAAVRVGNIYGEHICSFTGDDEEITISHKAFDRVIFAKGALACAEWIIGKPAKLYTAEDFLRDKLEHE